MPLTPAPGGVEDEQRYRPFGGVLHGAVLSPDRQKTCENMFAPPMMSPPTRLELCCASAEGVITLRARKRFYENVKVPPMSKIPIKLEHPEDPVVLPVRRAALKLAESA